MLLTAQQIQAAVRALGLHDDTNARSRVLATEKRIAKLVGKVEQLRAQLVKEQAAARRATTGALGLARSVAATEARLVDVRRSLLAQLAERLAARPTLTWLLTSFRGARGEAQVRAIGRAKTQAKDAGKRVFKGWADAEEAIEILFEPLEAAHEAAIHALIRGGPLPQNHQGESWGATNARRRARMRRLATASELSGADWRWLRTQLRGAASLEDDQIGIWDLEYDNKVLAEAVRRAAPVDWPKDLGGEGDTGTWK